MDALRENGATILAASPELVQRMVSNNPALITDSTFNDVMMRVLAGNAKGLHDGHLSGHLVVDQYGQTVTREEKEEQDRRRYAQISVSFTMSDIVTDALYNDVLNDAHKQLAEYVAARDEIQSRMDVRTQEINATQAQITEIQNNIRIQQIEIERKRDELASAENRQELLADQKERYARILAQGGAIDPQGNEYTRIEPGADGKPRFAMFDEAGRMFIRDANGLITGDALRNLLTDTKRDHQEATTTVTQTQDELTQMEAFHRDYLTSNEEVLQRMIARRDRLLSENSADATRLEHINQGIERTQNNIAYLQDPETRRKLEAGELTVAEMQDKLSGDSWNLFLDRNQKYKDAIPRAEMDPSEQQRYDTITAWLNRAKDVVVENVVAAQATVTAQVSGAVDSVSSTVSATVGNIVNTVTNAVMPAAPAAPAPTPVSATASDGQGIQSNVKLKTSFSTASENKPDTVVKQPDLQADAAFIPQRTVNNPMFAPGG